MSTVISSLSEDLCLHLRKVGWTPDRRVDVSTWQSQLAAQGMNEIPSMVAELWANLGGLTIPISDHPKRLFRDRYVPSETTAIRLRVDPIEATIEGSECVQDLLERANSFGKPLYPFALHLEQYRTCVFSADGEFIEIANSTFKLIGETPNEGLRNWVFYLRDSIYLDC